MGDVINFQVGMVALSILVGILLPLVIYAASRCTELYTAWAKTQPCEHFRVMAEVGKTVGTCVACGKTVDITTTDEDKYY